MDSDATVGVVKHADVDVAFPGTRRTVIRLRDGGICGCNLYAFLIIVDEIWSHSGRGLKICVSALGAWFLSSWPGSSSLLPDGAADT